MSTEHEEFEVEKRTYANAKIIGLTGGIASGKSTISSLFHEHGVAIIDADLISREVVQPNTPGLAQIADAFGDHLITPTGQLDRKRLGSIIFNDVQKREHLNAIIHPLVAARFLEDIQAHSRANQQWVIYDAALIVENNLQTGFEGLIVVSCDLEIQKERLMRRNQLSEIEANERIASQFPLQKKIEVANWIIDNSGTLEDSKKQVKDLFKILCKTFGPPKRREGNG